MAAEPLGIGRAELLAAVNDPAIKERLNLETDKAIARGVFGSPFVFVDGEPFWGSDRLDQTARRVPRPRRLEGGPLRAGQVPWSVRKIRSPPTAQASASTCR